MNAGRKIIIIDDDPAFTKATKAVLEADGSFVDSAQDGEEGLAKMSQQKPDLVLLDVMMAWPLEGVSVSREMMAQRDLQHIPIIMVTSIRGSELRGAFPQDEYLHIDSWLDKPCSPDQLLAEVERTLARYDKFAKNRVAKTSS